MSTRKQVSALRAKLMQQVRQGTELIHGIYDLYDQAAVEEMMPALINPILDTAAILTAEWYHELSPDSPYSPTEFFPVTEGRINYTTAWSFKLSGDARPVEHMSGAFQRMVFDSSRQTVIGNAKAEGVQWERDARAEACPFCRLLVVDPGAYQGKYVDMPSHNHDCECVAVASRDGNPYVPPDYVKTWADEEERKRSASLTATLAAMTDERV